MADSQQLRYWRAALCDLMIGRTLRQKAENNLAFAIACESDPILCVGNVINEMIAQAAHWEWIAVQAEQGQIGWGGRFNRCGYQPRTEEG